MEFFQLAPLIASISNLLLSAFVISRSYRVLTNRIFFYWGLALTTWTFGAFCLFRVQDEYVALTIARALHMGVIFLPVLYMHLAILVTGVPLRRLLPWAYALAVALAFSNLTDLFISGIRRVEGTFYAVSGPLYWVLSNMVSMLGVLSVWHMLKRRKKLDRLHRRRVSAMIAALVLLMVLGVHDLMPVLGIYYYPGTSTMVYPIGTFAAFMFPVVVSYSVLQNQLLDIRFALGRSAAMLVRILFFFAIAFTSLFLFALVLPEHFTLIGFGACLAAMLLSASISSVLFPKLLGAGAEALEQRILGDRFEYQEHISGFTETIHLYTDSNRLLADLEAFLHQIVRVRSLHIAVLDPHTNQLAVQHQVPPFSAHVDAELYAPIMEALRAEPAEVLDFRLDQSFSGKTHHLISRLGDVQPVLCLPLYSNSEPFGFVLLGGKQQETAYTSRDVELLVKLAKAVSLVLDQIRLKKRVELTEQLEALAVMSRGLAHDLNNLLTPIHTYLQILQLTPTSDPDEADLRKVATRNMETIRAYIRESVFFSNTLAPKVSLLSTDKLFEGVLSACKHQLDKSGVNIVCDVPVHFHFYGDSILLQRLLSNLVFNAIDASPAGTTITLRATMLPKIVGRAPWMRLQVVDQGAGISQENLARVFAPYFTTKNSGDKTRGFGLGLTICQKIVHLHHGNISLLSAEGKGTTVQVDLPTESDALPRPPNSP